MSDERPSAKSELAKMESVGPKGLLIHYHNGDADLAVLIRALRVLAVVEDAALARWLDTFWHGDECDCCENEAEPLHDFLRSLASATQEGKP